MWAFCDVPHAQVALSVTMWNKHCKMKLFMEVCKPECIQIQDPPLIFNFKTHTSQLLSNTESTLTTVKLHNFRHADSSWLMSGDSFLSSRLTAFTLGTPFHQCCYLKIKNKNHIHVPQSSITVQYAVSLMLKQNQYPIRIQILDFWFENIPKMRVHYAMCVMGQTAHTGNRCDASSTYGIPISSVIPTPGIKGWHL
jgi:hypothetical protein